MSTSPIHTLLRYGQLWLLLSCAGALLTGGCGTSEHDAPSVERRELLVSAAASLKDAFEEAAAEFEKSDSTVVVRLNVGASNLLARQIAEGAPVDLFAAAAAEPMDSLAAGGLIVPGTRVDIAGNQLVVAAPSGSDTLHTLRDLTEARFARIAVASPGVPARIYAEEALRAAGLWNALEPKFVYGANVRQVLDYVLRGEASVGFVYRSDAAQFSDRTQIVHIVDSALHRPIRYPVAITKNARNPEGGRAFIQFLRSSQGTAILNRHGFVPVR
jgi:molybdate transport system substrate-binding protein